MADKVQKILSEIATRKLCTMDEHMVFYNDKAKEDYMFLSRIEELIKDLQEEPLSEDLESAIGEYCSNPDNFVTYIDVAFAYRSEQKDDIPLIIKAIEFGARWQLNKIRKEAIDANIGLHYENKEGEFTTTL